MAILLVVLVLMNTYPLLVSEDLVFRAKRTALQSGASAINVAVSGLEELTEENVALAMESVETDGVSRAIVTDRYGKVLYDTREVGNATGYYVFYTELVEALQGNVSTYSVYKEGAFHSSAAQPVLYRNQVIGAVYVYEYDTQQASLLENLQDNLLSISIGVALLVLTLSAAVSRSITRRLESLQTAIRGVREGAYNQRAILSGHDEFTQIAGEFNDLVDRLQETESARPEKLLEGETININTASVLELQRLPGIGEARAQAIVDWREQEGAFTAPEDLTLVPGIGEGILAQCRDYITVEG